MITTSIVWPRALKSANAYPPVMAYCCRTTEILDPFGSITTKLTVKGVIGTMPFGTLMALRSLLSMNTEDICEPPSGSNMISAWFPHRLVLVRPLLLLGLE